MVKIRLTRLGRHKNPFYRIIATDSRNKRDGAYLELLGTYEPFEGKVKLHEEKIISFLVQGAKPTETTLNLLKANGVWKKYLDVKVVLKEAAKNENNAKKTFTKKAKTKSKAKKTTKKA